jgi:3'-phosphoadenosine 5'-phosphosulfate sulfotransferase (PAPS reductase)/FAD synthetase
VRPGLLDLLEEYGAYGLPARTKYKNGDIARRLIYEPAQKLALARGFDGIFMGLRREESRGRSFIKPCRLIKYDGLWHVNPVFDWTKDDIWAYISGNNLPYNAIYDQTKFHCRDDIRVAPWAGGTNKELGRFVELKYYHPELFDEFVRRFPHVRQYT